MFCCLFLGTVAVSVEKEQELLQREESLQKREREMNARKDDLDSRDTEIRQREEEAAKIDELLQEKVFPLFSLPSHSFPLIPHSFSCQLAEIKEIEAQKSLLEKLQERLDDRERELDERDELFENTLQAQRKEFEEKRKELHLINEQVSSLMEQQRFVFSLSLSFFFNPYSPPSWIPQQYGRQGARDHNA